MADGDRAFSVDQIRVDPPRVGAGQGLHRECLVQLNGPDIGPAQTRSPQGILGRLDGAIPKSRGSFAATPRPAVRLIGF